MVMIEKVFKSLATMTLAIVGYNYDNYATSYNSLNAGIVSQSMGIDELRSIAATFVKGEVLETAVGSGIQLNYYDWKKITSYVGEVIIYFKTS